jgi:hypothetical protein
MQELKQTRSVNTKIRGGELSVGALVLGRGRHVSD